MVLAATIPRTACVIWWHQRPRQSPNENYVALMATSRSAQRSAHLPSEGGSFNSAKEGMA